MAEHSPRKPRPTKTGASRANRQERARPSGAPRASALHPTAPPEPDLVMLLADPEIRLLMRADHVDEKELRTLLDAIAVQLRNGSGQAGAPTPQADAEDAAYRSGIGIMLLNDRSEIFVGRRNDVAEDAWQMPQGGIDDGETPQEAALRELKEEIGTDKVEVFAESARWLYYDVPAELSKAAWGGRWKGQRQKWFVMLFKGRDSDIDLATAHPEFDAWRWASLDELSTLAVSFKRRLYSMVIGEFAQIFRD